LTGGFGFLRSHFINQAMEIRMFLDLKFLCPYFEFLDILEPAAFILRGYYCGNTNAKENEKFIFSSSDLVLYMDSPFASWMNIMLLSVLSKTRTRSDGSMLSLLQKKGNVHELAMLLNSNPRVSM